jgi:ketosteroid isomerase-like protein
MTGDPFVAHRSLLFTVAYEMLGSAADAEDAVQESWLRWAGVDQSRVRVSRAEQHAVVERFLAALKTGRLQELTEVMAPDVVLIADGGGIAGAALTPVHGAELVARVLARASQFEYASATVWLNGAPAGRIEVAGEPAAVSLVVEDGRVTRVYLVRNPRKLTRLDEPADLAR